MYFRGPQKRDRALDNTSLDILSGLFGLRGPHLSSYLNGGDEFGLRSHRSLLFEKSENFFKI